MILVSLLNGCRSDNRDSTSSNLAAITEYAKAEVTIERLRKEPRPDWTAIAAHYEITSVTVKSIDAKHKRDYDVEIRQALDKCTAGQKPKVNQQVLAKGLQHVTVLAINDQLDAMAKSDDARSADAKIIAAYFEGIRPTFVRRDKDFFAGEKTLEKAAEQSLEHLSKAGVADLLTARRELEDAITRTYGLCVLFEIMDIEKLRDSDLDKCEVKRKEAQIFYRIIEPKVRRSSTSHQTIVNMLNAAYDAMNAAVLEENLQKALGPIKLR
jgi:hypothetical protein